MAITVQIAGSQFMTISAAITPTATFAPVARIALVVAIPGALPQALYFCAYSAPFPARHADQLIHTIYKFFIHSQNIRHPRGAARCHLLTSRHGGRDTIDDCHTARSHGARTGRQSVKCFVLNVIYTPAIPVLTATFAPQTATALFVIIIKKQKDYNRRGRSDCQKLCNFA